MKDARPESLYDLDTTTRVPPVTDTERPRVAVVGLGAMGSRLAANLIGDGYPVVVFNRTASAAGPLVAQGARLARSPREAASQSDVVLVAVRDDHASRVVWTDPAEGVLAGLGGTATAIECSTLSPGWVRELGAQAGGAFLEAPMIGTRPQVEARALVHLVGGPVASLDRVRAVLAVSSARVHHTGDVGTAATLKLIVNALLATQVVAIAELLGVAQRSGLVVAKTLELLTGLPVTSPAAGRAGGAMIRGAFSPNFPVDLVAKDLRYLAEHTAGTGGQAPMSRAALAQFDRLSGQGHGEEDIVAVARHFLTQQSSEGTAP